MLCDMQSKVKYWLPRRGSQIWVYIFQIHYSFRVSQSSYLGCKWIESVASRLNLSLSVWLPGNKTAKWQTSGWPTSLATCTHQVLTDIQNLWVSIDWFLSSFGNELGMKSTLRCLQSCNQFLRITAIDMQIVVSIKCFWYKDLMMTIKIKMRRRSWWLVGWLASPARRWVCLYVSDS